MLRAIRARWTRRTLGLCLGSALLALACASGGALTETHSPYLDAYRTKTELKNHLGARGMKCVPSRPGYELCGWTLGNRSESWQPIAESLPTRYKINVVCELPSGDTPRAADSCSVYPRVFLAFELAAQRLPAGVPPPDPEASKSEQARYALDSARDIVELSRLVGSHPHECHRRNDNQQLCRWQLSNQTAGHRLLAAVLDTGARVQLACLLPYSGNSRSADACEVVLPR